MQARGKAGRPIANVGYELEEMEPGVLAEGVRAVVS